MDVKAVIRISRLVEVEMYVPHVLSDEIDAHLRAAAEHLVAEEDVRELGGNEIEVVSWEKL